MENRHDPEPPHSRTDTSARQPDTPACLASGSSRVEAIAEAVKKRGHAWAMSAWLLFGASALAAEKIPIDRLMASTVCVVGEVPGGSFESSGFVVGAGDTVMTTAHAIGTASNLRVKLRDGRVFRAQLERLGNENADVALLGLGGLKLPPVQFGTLQDVHTGDTVLTIGCPLGFEFSVTSGVVSSIRASDLGYPIDSDGRAGESRLERWSALRLARPGRGRHQEHGGRARPHSTSRCPSISDGLRRARSHTSARPTRRSTGRFSNHAPRTRCAPTGRPRDLDPGLCRGPLQPGPRPSSSSGSSPRPRRSTARRCASGPGCSPAAINLGALLYEAKRYREAIDSLPRSARARFALR